MAPTGTPTDDGVNVDTVNSSMTNGPAGGTSTGDRSWERPWTLEEIRKGASNWSLAGDSGLLLYLQEFSQKMIARTHEVEKEVETLLHEAKLTDVRVSSVINDFIMLANTQFVENRVYDEDVSHEEVVQEEKKTEVQEKTKEQREAELISKVTEAVKLGVEVIDQFFDKLDANVANSDSEDEDETAYKVDPIFEAKDPYLNRPLPYLIGTPNFINDDNVGLIDMSDEEEESDHGSLSESEPEVDKKDWSESEYSNSESESDSGKPPPRKPATVSDSDTEESDSEGDLFSPGKGDDESDYEDDDREKDSEEEKESEEKSKAPLTGFAAELAAKIGVPQAKLSADSNEVQDGDEKERQASKETKKRSDTKGSKGGKKKEKDSKTSKSTQKEKGAEEDPFGQPDEDDDPFGTAGGLFSSKKKGLFDEDEEEGGGLFDDVIEKKGKEKERKKKDSESDKEEKSHKTRSRTSSGKNVPAGGVSLFGDDGGDLFSSVKEESIKEKVTPAVEKKQPSFGGGGLFEEEEEDDLFGTQTKSTSKVKQEKTESQPVKKPVVSDLFGDEEEGAEDGLLGSGSLVKKKENEETKPKKNEKKLPSGAVSMFGGAPNPLNAALRQKMGLPNSSDEEDNDALDGDKSHNESIKSSQSASSISSTSKLPQDKKIGRSGSQSSSLFDEDPDDALFAEPIKPRASSITKGKTKPTTSLFGNEEAEEDLFSAMNKSKPVVSKVESSKAQTVSSKTAAASLFDEEDEEDLFAATSTKQKGSPKKSMGGVSLLPESADVLGKKKEEQKTEPEKKVPAKAVPALSLFGDDGNEEQEDNLFGGKPITVKPVAQPDQSKPRSKSGRNLFDEEGFFQDQEESPAVDLFGGQKGSSSAKPKEQVTPDEPLPTRQSKTAAPDLFGEKEDEEEDDMFVTKKDEKVEEIVKPKKPVGGVSMFGGINPFAPSAKKTEEPSHKEEPKKSPVLKRKPIEPLFGDDENDEDDLLGSQSKPPSKKLPVKEFIPSAEDDLFSSQSKQEKKESRSSPVDDLFGSQSKPPPKKEPVKESKPSPIDDLFGSQSKPPPRKEPVTESKPSPVDDLFGSQSKPPPKKEPVKESKPSPVDDLFGSQSKPPPRKEPVTESKPSPVDDLLGSQSKPPPKKEPVKESKPSPVDDLFGSQSKPPPRKEPVKESKPSPVDDLFGSQLRTDTITLAGVTTTESVDEQPSQKQDEEETVKPREEAVKPKRPVGGVSMFGGFDPFAQLKQQGKASAEEKKEIPVKKDPLFGEEDANDLFGSSSKRSTSPTPQLLKPSAQKSADKEDIIGSQESEDKEGIFGSQESASAGSPSSLSGMKQEKSLTVQHKIPTGKIGKLQANLAINPAALMPGAAPPMKEEAPQSVGFDQPADVKTLQSATKDRAKVQIKRRPPSRKGRTAQTSDEGEDPFFSAITEEQSNPVTLSEPRVPSSPTPDRLSPNFGSPPKKDLFGNDDLFNISPSKPRIAIETKDSHSTEDDIFGSPFKSKSKVAIKDDDLFSSSLTAKTSTPKSTTPDKEEDLFSGPYQGKEKSKTKASSEILDDDLFSSPGSKIPPVSDNSKSTEKVKKEERQESSSVTKEISVKAQSPDPGFEDDDLLASSSLKKKKGKEQLQEDDIFGDSSLNKKESKKKVDEEEEDLFGKSIKTERKKHKKAQTKDEDLFKDDTDIFADVPAAKPREKKKKKTTSSAPKKTIFKDDIDDIFAEALSPPKSKEKKEKKTTPVATATQHVKSPIGDDDDIFADPLS